MLTFYNSMPNITDGVSIIYYLLFSTVRGQACLLLFQQSPGACSVLSVPEEFPLITRETPAWEGCTEKSVVKIREESSTQTPLERESKLSSRFPQQLGICNDSSKFRGFTFKKRCVSIPVCYVADEAMPSSN